MRLPSTLLLFLALLLPVAAEASDVVLVVSARSPVRELSSLQTRKLFLGLPVLVDGTPLRPVRNNADTRLEGIFFQQIVAMSQEQYDRQMLRGFNVQGRLRPVVAASSVLLFELLRADPFAVSYAWRKDVENDGNIRVLRVLWTE